MLPRIAPWLWGSVMVCLHKAERGNSDREGWSGQHPFSSSRESLKASLACTSALSFAILLRGGMETSHKKKKKKRVLQENNLKLYLHFSTVSNPLMVWGHFLLPIPFYSGIL